MPIIRIPTCRCVFTSSIWSSTQGSVLRDDVHWHLPPVARQLQVQLPQRTPAKWKPNPVLQKIVKMDENWWSIGVQIGNQRFEDLSPIKNGDFLVFRGVLETFPWYLDRWNHVLTVNPGFLPAIRKIGRGKLAHPISWCFSGNWISIWHNNKVSVWNISQYLQT